MLINSSPGTRNGNPSWVAELRIDPRQEVPETSEFLQKDRGRKLYCHTATTGNAVQMNYLKASAGLYPMVSCVSPYMISIYCEIADRQIIKPDLFPA